MINAHPTDKKRLVEVVPTQDVSGRIILANVFFDDMFVKTVNSVVPSLTQSHVTVVIENQSEETRIFNLEVQGRLMNSETWKTINSWLVDVPPSASPQVIRRTYSRGDFRNVNAFVTGLGSDLNVQEYYLSKSETDVADGLVFGGKAGETIVIPCDFTGMSPSSNYSLVVEAEDIGVISRDRLLVNGEDGYPRETAREDIMTYERPKPDDFEEDSIIEAPVIGTIVFTSSSATIPFTEVEGATGYQLIINDDQITTTNEGPFVASDLDPETEYTFRVRATIGNDPGVWSQPKTITTDAAPVNKPTVAPVIGDIETTTSTAKIFYSGVSGAEGYRYRINGGDPVDVGLQSQYTIVGLSDYSTFLIEKQAYNAAGDGPWSDTKLFTTKALKPENAPQIASVETTDTELTLVFTTVPKTDFYEVQVDDREPVEVHTSPGTVPGLDIGESGTVRMRAVNPAGESDWSNVVSFTMKHPVQTRPEILSVSTDKIISTAFIQVTAVLYADFYEYSLDNGVTWTQVAGTVFGITPASGSYNIIVRGANVLGPGPESDPRAVEFDFDAPVITDPTITWDSTNSQYVLSVEKATDNNTADESLQYFVVEGDLEVLQSPQLIQQLTSVASGENQDTFTVERERGFAEHVTVYVRDQAGNISIYTPVFIEIFDPKILSITVNPTSIEGDVGTTAQLEISVQTQDGADDSYTALIGNESIATIDANDIVSKIAEGLTEAVITSVFDPSVSVTVPIQVNAVLDPRVLGITVSPDPISIQEGQTQQMDISVQTADGANDSYTTSIDNESIATIDANDLLSGVAEGEAILTVTAVFDGSTVQIPITITEIIVSDGAYSDAYSDAYA